jgi:hypothetical protein
MRIWNAMIATLLVLIASSAAGAATLRTAPFPGALPGVGGAFCQVVNAGNVAGTVVLKIFNRDGELVDVGGGLVQPKGSAGTPGVDLELETPMFCECTVPSTANFRCSFVYVNAVFAPSVITIIEGR